jgi:hypothetical protein
MNYSKIHQDFAERVDDNKVLEYPENYLGPNYETVLNYWWYLDSLSRYYTFDSDCYADKPVGYGSFIIGQASIITRFQSDAWGSTNVISKDYWYGWATVELICMHRILDEGKSLFYLPKIFNE